MKNIQVIDGAVNSTFEVYEIPNDVFDMMFPHGADVAFLKEIEKAFDGKQEMWRVVYSTRVDKKQVSGIQGTLHLTGSNCSPEFFPHRKESDVQAAD